MEQQSTDREVLVKGVKNLAFSVVFLFAGPILIYIGAGSEHPIIFLMPGIVFAILAVYLIFKGINLILDAMFKSNKTR